MILLHCMASHRCINVCQKITNEISFCPHYKNINFPDEPAYEIEISATKFNNIFHQTSLKKFIIRP